MNTRYYRLLTPLFVLMALLMAACSSEVATDDEDPLSEGMGRIRITICTPEDNPNLTRAVNLETTWLEPDHEWERLQTFRILICDEDNKVVKILTGGKADMSLSSATARTYKQSAEITTEISAGTYKIYATANYDDGYTVGSQIDLDEAVRFSNGYSKTGTDHFGGDDDATNPVANAIPMTGKLEGSVQVEAGQTKNAGTIIVWRVMSKLQFLFTNEATENIDIYGIEVEPINTNASNQGLIYLFSKDNLTSTANLPVGGGVILPSGITNGKVKHPHTPATPPTSLLSLDAKGGTKTTGDIFFYVNETNGTFTTTQNEISLRFKIRRGDATEDELRYGLTTHYGDGSTGQDGFNVIRRNDWIHIPIVLTDWQYRVEPLAFVPIAGYPAETVSSDGLTATYKTGGMIALQPFIRKKTATGYTTWLDFDNPEVTFVSLSWKNSDGDNIAYYNSDGTVKDGDTSDPTDKKIVNTAFAYDPVTKCIIGELNNDLTSGSYKTTITINVDLGAEPLLYHYTFSCNVILQ